MSDTTQSQPTSVSRPSRLARWAVPLAIAVFAILGVVSSYFAIRLETPAFFTGFLAAVYAGLGVLAWGLVLPESWPGWAHRVAGTLLLAGAAELSITGALVASGRVSMDAPFLPVSVALCAVMLPPALLFLGAGWVYSDAHKRGLNAGLWALLCLLLFPYLLGFIIYLVMVLVRDQRMMVCPRCSARQTPGLVYCTACGAQMQRTCTECAARLPQGAAYCGNCGAAAAQG